MPELRKTKIICTLGPSVDDEETLRQLILAGMNAARFNFSHGTHESQLATLQKLKRVRDELGLSLIHILLLSVDGLHDGLMQLGRRLDLPPRLEGVLLADFLGVGVPELVKPELDG